LLYVLWSIISRMKAIISISPSAVRVYSILQKFGSSTLKRFITPYFILYSFGIKFFLICSPQKTFSLRSFIAFL